MNREQFQQFCDDFRTEAKEIMDAKNQDYRTGSVNQLHYDDIAKDLGITPFQAWAVLFMKQVHAVLRFARDGRVSSESILSRLYDIHNYAVLGAALLADSTDKPWAQRCSFQVECEPDLRSLADSPSRTYARGGDPKPGNGSLLVDAITEACECGVSFDALPEEVGDPNAQFVESLQDLLTAWLKNPDNSRTPNVADVLDGELATMSWTKPVCTLLKQYVNSHDLGLSMKLENVIKRLKGE